MTLSKITPLEAKRLVDDGGVLVDIRGTAEHARERIPGARNLPLGSGVKVEASAPVVFHCRSGGRTSANAATLAQAAATARPTFSTEASTPGNAQACP